MTAPGPFDTEQDARAAAHEMVPPEPDHVILSGEQNLQLLEDACCAAGVELGTYDTQLLVWLARFDDAMCAAVAGLILRAAASQHDSESEER